MALLKRYLLEAVDTMEKDHIRLHFFGDMTPIAPDLRALARETDEITEHLSKDDFQANVCLNYGGRDEILRAAGVLPPTAPPGRSGRRSWMMPCSPAIWTLRGPGPGAHHPAQRRAAVEQLPAVAVCLFGVLLHGYPVAGLRRSGAGPGHCSLPTERPPVRRRKEINLYRN